jgi:hypothetical protein
MILAIKITVAFQLMGYGHHHRSTAWQQGTLDTEKLSLAKLTTV